MITHRNAAINTIGTLLHLPMGVGSRYLWTLPILHANGWTYTWTVPPTAGTHICLRKVDPATIFGLAPGVTRLAGFGLARWRAEAAGRGNEACFQATVLNSDPGLVCRLKLRRRPVRLRRGPVPLMRPRQVNDRGAPGLVVPPGGARVGVSHGALEIAE